MKGWSVLFITTVLSLVTIYARADIVGGDPVEDSDPIRSSTIGLYTPSPDGRGGAICTGSLIDKDLIVTAAHCITPGTKPIVVFGKDMASRTTPKRLATGAVVNPRWQHSRGRGLDQGDIALVRFPGGLPQGFHPARRASSDKNFSPNEDVTLAGFGITNSRTHAGAGRLRKTHVSLFNPRRGKSEMILDQSRGHGACHGDSGGPAFVNVGGRPVLAGVTNRSYPDNAPDDCGHQVVYTKVSAYRNWIAQEKKILRAEHEQNLRHTLQIGNLSHGSHHRAVNHSKNERHGVVGHANSSRRHRRAV